jgi:hypothetical protein
MKEVSSFFLKDPHHRGFFDLTLCQPGKTGSFCLISFEYMEFVSYKFILQFSFGP